jgi:hypothetical protein
VKREGGLDLYVMGYTFRKFGVWYVGIDNASVEAEILKV